MPRHENAFRITGPLWGDWTVAEDSPNDRSFVKMLRTGAYRTDKAAGFKVNFVVSRNKLHTVDLSMTQDAMTLM